MQTVNMHQAKTQLSKLVEGAVKGEPFIIARAGKPLVKVEALQAPTEQKMKRVGFFDGKFTVPDDFKTRWAAEIEEMFYGSDDTSDSGQAGLDVVEAPVPHER